VHLPFLVGIFILTAISSSEATLCKKPNGTMIVRSECAGKLVPVSVADLGAVGLGAKGDKGDTGDLGPQGPRGPQGAPGQQEVPPAQLVSVFKSFDSGTAPPPLYSVPANQDFILTDIDWHCYAMALLSDSSGTRLAISPSARG